MITLYVAISAHGFGHGTRTIAVINELIRLNPQVLPAFVTTLPHWLFEKYLEGPFLYRPRRLDVGVIQQDSLQMDLAATVQTLADLQKNSPQIIQSEASFIATNRIPLVYADVPPLAAAIAQAARIPCWMASNFGWNYIYRPYGDPFIPAIDWMETLYSQVDRLFRLPMHEPMAVFPRQESIGLTGADPRFTPEQLREKLQLEEGRPRILMTFGGLGIQNIPYHRLDDFPEWHFISFDHDAPDLPNLLKLDGQQWRPVDLMPICDRLLAKPGYSTLSEAMKVGIPVSCLTREGFNEAELLLDGLQRFSGHQIVPQSVFFEEPWQFLHDPMLDPTDPDPVDRHGNQTLAQALNQALTGELGR